MSGVTGINERRNPFAADYLYALLCKQYLRDCFLNKKPSGILHRANSLLVKMYLIMLTPLRQMCVYAFLHILGECPKITTSSYILIYEEVGLGHQ